MEHLSAFKKADGLESDGGRILRKYSPQEVKTGVEVIVGKLYAEKELYHTQISRQVQPKQTRRPMM